MKKLLLSIYTFFAIMSYQIGAQPDSPLSIIAQTVASEPRHIDPIIFELTPETEEHIRKRSATIGAICATALAATLGNNTKLKPLTCLLSATVVGTAIGIICYKYQVNSSDTKKDEAAMNALIHNSNKAYKAHCTVNLDPHQRATLQQLLSHDPQVAEHQRSLYAYLKSLAEYVANRDPAKHVPGFLDEKYEQLKEERACANSIITEHPILKSQLSEQQKQLINNIQEQLQQNKNGIMAYADMIPSYHTICDWVESIKNTPQYKIDERNRRIRLSRIINAHLRSQQVLTNQYR